MYQQYFGLSEQPFSIAVNPRYLFMSARHRDALAHLLYGVGSGGGFILLTGEVGTGKTTLNRCLLEQLPEQTDIAIVLNPALSAVELLATVCDEFEVEYEHGVGYRNTMRFEDRNPAKLGPVRLIPESVRLLAQVGKTRIWGQKRTGFDGIEYVETPDGYLPMADPSGKLSIIREVLSQPLSDDLARVAQASCSVFCA